MLRGVEDGLGIAVIAGIAAMVAAGAVLVRERPAPRPTAVFRTAAAAIAAPVEPWRSRVPKARCGSGASPVEQPFVAIPYTVPLAPEENATVVRMTITPSAMAVAGFPLPAIDPGPEPRPTCWSARTAGRARFGLWRVQVFHR